MNNHHKKNINKYTPSVPSQIHESAPLHIVLATWMCALGVLVFFIPQLNAYQNTLFDQKEDVGLQTVSNGPLKKEQAPPPPNMSKETYEKPKEEIANSLI